jgi:N-acylneuraminate cytidylyltransferase
MNIIAFIPCRKNSKSIKDKNIKMLDGKPLIAWSIEQAQKLGLRVIVDSDSQQYLDIAKGYGAETLLRPENLAGDKTKMFDVLKNEIPRIEPKPDIVLLLQPTTPFRKTNQIKIALSYFENNSEYDSLISVERVPEKYNPAVMLVKTLEGIKMANGFSISQRITDRQANPDTWIPTGAIYLFKASNLEKGSIYGDKTMLLEGDAMININSESDFLEAENYLKQKNANNS